MQAIYTHTHSYMHIIYFLFLWGTPSSHSFPGSGSWIWIFSQGRKYRNSTLEVMPPQSDVVKLYKSDLMMSSSCQLIGFIFKGVFLEIKVKSSSFSLGREENKWIWKMLQRDYQQDLIQCQNEGIRREGKKLLMLTLLSDIPYNLSLL